MKSDYDIIKDKYSERMAKLCRKLFPTILENEGVLSSFLLSKFNPGETLFQDLAMSKVDSFKNFINSFFFNVVPEKIDTNKSVEELLDMAGYKIFECNTYEDMLKFKKYYVPEEELCSFSDENRVNMNYVFFAIKKDVDSIKRKDFLQPLREDRYGTSVISIQIDRSSNTLSIKNRYNHRVSNPDSTFSNNLDNIIPGLTSAFEKEYGLEINKCVESKLVLPDYVVASDGKYYKYNYCINKIYYGTNNIIIDEDKIIKLDSSRYRLVDYYLIDYKDKMIKLYDNNIQDSFSNKKLKRIEVHKDKKTKDVYINLIDDNNENIYLKIDKLNRMESLNIKNKKIIEDNFLYKNQYLNYISLDDVEKIGDDFLSNNYSLSELNLPKVEEVGNNFLRDNEFLMEVNLPNLKKIKDDFIYTNSIISKVNLPLLEEVGDEFLFYNNRLKRLDLPNLEYIGKIFLINNNVLEELNLPSIKKISLDDGGNMRIINLLSRGGSRSDREVNSKSDTEDEEIKSNTTRRK